MPTNTYVALDKVTASGSVNTVTISSIPTTYTDLTIVVSGNLSGSANRASLAMRVGNGSPNSSSIYSNTQLSGNGTSAYSNRGTNETYCFTGVISEKIGTTVINIMNYANTTTYKTVLSRGNSLGQTATQDVGAFVNLWRSTSAINTIQFYTGDGTNFASGTTFSLYGIKAEPVVTAKATGGTITYSADGYTYHTFTSSGTFTPTQSLTVDALVVAGGGGGSNAGGGGGAGGLLALASQAVTATGYTVTVGAGAAGSTGGNYAAAGSNSLFGGLGTAIGGGGGSRVQSGNQSANIGGGSGGGAAGGTAATYPGAGTSGQGNAGGQGNPSSSSYSAGGGGGAGAVGGNYNSVEGGNGGAGSSSYLPYLLATNTGSSGYIAGGGGGGGGYNGSNYGGRGGIGGGGTGGTGSTGTATAGTAATANTGSGGGGGAVGNVVDGNGGNGGSGLVIIRYVSA